MMDGFGVHEMLSVAFFMLIVTISVVVLVASGIEHDHFCKKYDKRNLFFWQIPFVFNRYFNKNANLS